MHPWLTVCAGWPPRRVPVRSRGRQPLKTAFSRRPRCHVDRTEAAVPDRAADLVTDLDRRMPEAGITDTSSRWKTPPASPRPSRTCGTRPGATASVLLNVPLAEGINLGLRKMAEATTTHGLLEVDAHRPLPRGRGPVRPRLGRRRRDPGRAADSRYVPFGIATEVADALWAPGHQLAHIGLRSTPLATADLPRNNLRLPA